MIQIQNTTVINKFYWIHFWPGLRQADCCYDVRGVLLEVDLLSCHSIEISRILKVKMTLWRIGYPKMFLLDNAKTKQSGQNLFKVSDIGPKG